MVLKPQRTPRYYFMSVKIFLSDAAQLYEKQEAQLSPRDRAMRRVS